MSKQAGTRKQASKRYQETTTPQLKYGLTIRLRTKGLDLQAHEQPDKQPTPGVTNTNCEVQELFTTNTSAHKHLYTTKAADHTRFDDFNYAHANQGLLITVPENAQATCELDRELTKTSVEHVLVVAHKNSTLQLIDRQTGSPELHSATVEVIAHEGAHVQYATIQTLDTWDLTSYRGVAHKDAQIDWFVASLGAGFQRATVDTQLVGAGAGARSYGVFLGVGSEQFDLSATSYHEADNTSSDMHTKGVLDGKSKGVYRGTIDIAADAFGCDGYQKEHTILLSEDAVADAIPNLEIRNNDVRCSHGATIGRVDDEQLFYLTSRGIDRQEAVRMLVKGFFEPLTSLLEWPQLYQEILPIVEEQVL